MNKTNGGEYSVTGFKHSDESKKKISDAQIGRKMSDEWRRNISIGRNGIKFSDEHLINLSKSHIGLEPNANIPIYQIDINTGEILNKFDSIVAAYKYLNLDSSNSSLISTACKGKVKSAYGCYWCYSDKYNDFVFKKYYRIYNPILQFDKNGKLIKEYDNISKAAKENNLNQSHISHALTDSPSCGGYVWVYKNSDYTNILKEKLSKIKRQYILNQLDLKTGEILRTFNSIKEAQELTNIRHIGDVLSGKRNYAGGYKWSKSL